MTMTPEQRTATLSELVADRIYIQLKGHRRMSQAQLAKAIGKTEMWVSLRLRGKQAIDLNDLWLIAGALGVGVHELLPTPEDAARASAPAQTSGSFVKEPYRGFKSSPELSVRAGLPSSPVGHGRTDSRRPVSAIPATRRRPQAVLRPGNRPKAA